MIQYITHKIIKSVLPQPDIMCDPMISYIKFLVIQSISIVFCAVKDTPETY